MKASVRVEQRAGDEGASSGQSRLAARRREARARHVLYSLCRGRCWAQIENNRPDGDPKLGYAMARLWNEALSSTKVEALPLENLRPWVERWL